MADKKINVGVIGYGLSAKVFHIPLILTTSPFHLYSIVQRPSSANSSAATDHPGTIIHNTAEHMLLDPAVDLAVITTPPQTHFSLTKIALEAGKHVLIEKPFVPSSVEASALISLAQEKEKLICVYQNRRWDSDFLTLRKLQKEGQLGRIVEFESHFDRYRPAGYDSSNWKGGLKMEEGGGVLYDLGTHLVDQVVVAFGMPRRVTAVFQCQRQDAGKASEEPDSITLLLHYDKGMLATIKASVLSLEASQLRFWVRGTEGSYMKLGMDVQEEQLKAGMMPRDEGFGREREGQSGWLTRMEGEKPTPVRRPYRNVDPPETYAALYRAFADAIHTRDKAMVPVKAEEARDVLKVIEAARESARMGRSVDL